MIDLADVIGMVEAGELSGRAPSTMRRAAELGTLEAKRIGEGRRRPVWVTTRQAVSAYVADIASRAYHSVPQRQARPGGQPRPSRRTRLRRKRRGA